MTPRKSPIASPDSALGCSIGPGPSCRWPPPGDVEAAAHGRGHAHPSRNGAPGGDAHAHTHAHGAHARHAGKGALKWVLALLAVFLVGEVAGGIVAHSLALLADAGHMLTDVAAVGFSLFAIRFAQRPATAEKTYGYLRLEIIAALLNGATLIVISLFIFIEGYRRIRAPGEVHGALMLAVAAAGLAVNVVAALLLRRSSGESLNVRGAYLHVLGDLLGFVGTIAAAVVILLTGWTVADPIISIGVGVLILGSAWKLVRESVEVLLEAVPAHIDLGEVRRVIDDVPGVEDVHDLHVWTVTSGVVAMSGHAVVHQPGDHQLALDEIHQRMRERFGIGHVTFQLERDAMYAREHPNASTPTREP